MIQLILDNQITNIYKNSFSGLSNLKKLYLERNLNDLILVNQITKIDRDSFNSLSKLKELYLQSNLNDLILDNQITNIQEIKKEMAMANKYCMILS